MLIPWPNPPARPPLHPPPILIHTQTKRVSFCFLFRWQSTSCYSCSSMHRSLFFSKLTLYPKSLARFVVPCCLSPYSSFLRHWMFPHVCVILKGHVRAHIVLLVLVCAIAHVCRAHAISLGTDNRFARQRGLLEPCKSALQAASSILKAAQKQPAVPDGMESTQCACFGVKSCACG